MYTSSSRSFSMSAPVILDAGLFSDAGPAGWSAPEWSGKQSGKWSGKNWAGLAIAAGAVAAALVIVAAAVYIARGRIAHFWGTAGGAPTLAWRLREAGWLLYVNTPPAGASRAQLAVLERAGGLAGLRVVGITAASATGPVLVPFWKNRVSGETRHGVLGVDELSGMTRLAPVVGLVD